MGEVLFIEKILFYISKIVGLIVKCKDNDVLRILVKISFLRLLLNYYFLFI